MAQWIREAKFAKDPEYKRQHEEMIQDWKRKAEETREAKKLGLPPPKRPKVATVGSKRKRIKANNKRVAQMRAITETAAAVDAAEAGAAAAEVVSKDVEALSVAAAAAAEELMSNDMEAVDSMQPAAAAAAAAHFVGGTTAVVEAAAVNNEAVTAAANVLNPLEFIAPDGTATIVYADQVQSVDNQQIVQYDLARGTFSDSLL